MLKEGEKKSTSQRQPCEVYSRIVGYLSPVNRWNAGKVSEYAKRKEFNKQLIEDIHTPNKKQ